MSLKSEPLEILILIGSLDIGGTERHLCQVLPLLNNHKLHFTVVTFHHRGLLASTIEEQGVEVINPCFPTWIQNSRVFHMFATVWWLSKLLKKRRPDIIHMFLPAAYLLGGLCAMFSGVPTRIMSRRSLNIYQKRHPILTRVETWLHKYMDLLIGNSTAVVDELKEEVGTRNTEIKLIHNGIDTIPFDNALPRWKIRSDLNIPDSTFVIIFVANIIPYKGHSDLIDALKHVASKFPNPWQLICVGRDDGPLSQLRGKIKRLGLQDNVVWLGPRSDIPDLLCAGDIAVLPSHEEGMSNVVLESMAARLPTVTTKVGGNTDMVVHGKTGLVVPPKAPCKLGHAIVTLATDKRQRTYMGNAGRQRVEDNFSLERCVKGYHEVYLSFHTNSAINQE